METKRPPAGLDLAAPPSGPSPAPRARNKSNASLFAGLALAGVVVVGCIVMGIIYFNQPKEGVKQYEVSRPPMERMLAALFLRKDGTWFVKLQGPAPEVAGLQKDFDAFVRSIRFTDQADKPLTWTVPKGWKQEPGQGFRVATFRVGQGKKSLEISVSRLGPEASDLSLNINRWRRQLGLGPILREIDGDLVARRIEVPGARAWLVDMTGPGGKNGMPPMFPGMKGHPPIAGHPAGPAPATTPRYTVPQGWTRRADPGQFSLEAFDVREGDKVIEVSVTPVSGPGRGLYANVLRWRNQLNLPPISQEDVQKGLGRVEVEGKPVPFVALTGTDGQGNRRKTLAAGLDQGDQTYYFTMKGPADLVDKHQAEFKAFLKSVQFGGEGAKHE